MFGFISIGRPSSVIKAKLPPLKPADFTCITYYFVLFISDESCGIDSVELNFRYKLWLIYQDNPNFYDRDISRLDYIEPKEGLRKCN